MLNGGAHVGGDVATRQATHEDWSVAIVEDIMFRPKLAPVTVHLHYLLREQEAPAPWQLNR